MGTDIHMIGETYDKWDKKYKAFSIPDKFTNRYYSFFAALGNVRNGSGFAGVYRHEPIEPLSDCRGIPENAGEYAESLLDESFVENGLDISNWLGDHSISHVGLDELKSYNWPTVIHGGVMPYSQWLEWDKHSRPESYSGGVSGNNIITIDESEVNNYVFDESKEYYVSFKFNAPLVEPDYIKEFISYLELFKSWESEDKDVRIIFGFDS